MASYLTPIIGRRMTAALQAELGSRVSLGTITTRIHGDLEIDLHDLAAQSVLHGIPGDPEHPMLRVRHATFHIGLLDALLGRMNLRNVHADGVFVEQPPVSPISVPSSKSAIHLDRLTLQDAHVLFHTGDPHRAALRFDLPRVTLTGLDEPSPTAFSAIIDAGDPIGLVQTSGTLGPWQTADPRSTAIQGGFAFDHRSVASVRGLRGSLSMQAAYHGTLGEIDTEGDTEDPAFGFDVSAHPVPLRTHFRMTEDAVHGILHLQTIDAHLLQTHFLLRGDVTRSAKPAGYVLNLTLVVPQGRIEDGLLLAAPTTPSLLRGAMTLQSRLYMAAGPESVSRKLQLHDGHFQMTAARFGDPAVQRNADAMSERALGHPEDATPSHAAPSYGGVAGRIDLRDGIVHLSAVDLTVPGARLALGGTWQIGGARFDVRGTIHTLATASQMNTGVKRLLTRPFNGLFSHGKSGATLPLEIIGSGNSPRFQVTLPGGKRITVPGMKQ